MVPSQSSCAAFPCAEADPTGLRNSSVAPPDLIRTRITVMVDITTLLLVRGRLGLTSGLAA